jgi:pimeloyl-ACP methyl ester carboxylesterase
MTDNDRTLGRRRVEAVEVGPRHLPGELVLPPQPAGLVVFAHGSGSSRLSPRNTYVAGVLHQRSLGTLLFDLLTVAEADRRANVFDIELLGERLGHALQWITQRTELAGLPVGLFGASTGAAAALVAAATAPQAVAAVVSRGGRPDLAGRSLPRVTAPTLLIVGSDDTAVLELNRKALAAMTCTKRLAIVPGATHLFEEPGTLEAVAELAARWFGEYLETAGPRSGPATGR